jgi:hypothetical protein
MFAIGAFHRAALAGGWLSWATTYLPELHPHVSESWSKADAFVERPFTKA